MVTRKNALKNVNSRQPGTKLLTRVRLLAHPDSHFNVVVSGTLIASRCGCKQAVVMVNPNAAVIELESNYAGLPGLRRVSFMTSKRRILPVLALSVFMLLVTPVLASAQTWRYQRYDRWRNEQVERRRIERLNRERYYNPYSNRERYEWRRHHRNGFQIRIN
jgi:hypothetical protein